MVIIWLIRTARVTWIMSVIQVLFICVIKAKRVIITLNEYAKASRSVRHQVSGKDGVCNLSAHFAERNCTDSCRQERPHGLRRGARRRPGCPGHPGCKLCSLTRLFFRTDFVLVRAL
jgi:hypothetical protein